MPARAPIALADLPADWLAVRREMVAREGARVRAGAGPWIEIWSEARAAWLRLALPDNAIAFATAAERDTALAALLA